MDVFVSEGDDFHLPLVPGYTCSAAQTGIQPASSFLDVEPGASIAVTVTNQMTCSKDEFDITVTKVWAPTVGLQPGDTAPVLGPDNAGALLVTVTDGEGQPVGTANVWDSKATFPWSEGTDVTVSEGAQFNLPVVPGYTCSAVQTGISPQSTFENVDKDAELEVTVTNQMTCSKDQFDITVTKAWAPTVGLADGVTVTLGPENAGSLLVSVSDGNNQPVGTANAWGAKATFPWSAGTDVTVSEGSNFTIPVIDGYTCTAAQTGISQSSFTDVEKGASLQVTVTNQLTCTQDETPVAPVVPVVPEEPVTPVVVPEKPVTPVVVPEQPDSNATLPRTGGSDNTGQMALLASVLLLVGTGVLFASRRRSEADES